MALTAPSSTLTGQTIAASYDQVLFLDAAAGVTEATLKIVSGTAGKTALSISDEHVLIKGVDTNNAAGFEVQQTDGTSILKIAAGTPAATLIGPLTVGADDLGHDVIFYGDTASSNMTWDTSGDDLILNDATLSIDQDDNVVALTIDTEATSAIGIYLDCRMQQDSEGLYVYSAGGARTTGSMAKFHSADTNTNNRSVVEVINDEAAATGAVALTVRQDAAVQGVVIEQNGNNQALKIDTAATTNHGLYFDAPATTTGNVISVADADSLTTGKLAYLYSNSSDNSTRNLMEIINDHASSDNTVNLYLHQDGADAHIELQGVAGGIKFGLTPGSGDANTLDDYEEGTWTGTFTAGTGSFGQASNTMSYTKVGRAVTICGLMSINSESAASGHLSILGLPFTSGTGDQYKTTVSLWGNGLGANKVIHMIGEIGGARDNIDVFRGDSAAITSDAASDLDGGCDMRFNATYFV